MTCVYFSFVYIFGKNWRKIDYVVQLMQECILISHACDQLSLPRVALTYRFEIDGLLEFITSLDGQHHVSASGDLIGRP